MIVPGDSSAFSLIEVISSIFPRKITEDAIPLHYFSQPGDRNLIKRGRETIRKLRATVIFARAAGEPATL